MNRHAGCLIVTAEDPQKADGIAVAHLAEIYVHGKLSRRDIEPIKDLLDALVAGELSGVLTRFFGSSDALRTSRMPDQTLAQVDGIEEAQNAA